MDMEIDIENFDRDTRRRIEINKEDKEKLNLKVIIHKKCGNKHIDKEKFAEFNHRKHLCHYCDEYFYDDERGIGI